MDATANIQSSGRVDGINNSNRKRERGPDGASSPHRCDEEKAGVGKKEDVLVEGQVYMQFKYQVMPDPVGELLTVQELMRKIIRVIAHFSVASSALTETDKDDIISVKQGVVVLSPASGDCHFSIAARG